MRQIPDISQYERYRVSEDVTLEGTVFPGLTGGYYQRREGERWATVGLYTYAGEPVFAAWGYRDEAHCAWTSYRDGSEWTVPHRGCPRITRISLLVAQRASPDPGAEACYRVG